MRELLAREVHSGRVAGHFGVQKTLDTLNKIFYWLDMMKDVDIIVSKCATCKMSKSTFHKGL